MSSDDSATHTGSGSQEQALAEIRAEIDRIDFEIQRLINQRAACAQHVAEVKAQFESHDAIFYRPEREAQVLRAVMDRNEGPVPAKQMARLFRELMSVCLSLEQQMCVLYVGSDKNLSERAARKQFGDFVEYQACSSFGGALDSITEGKAQYLVIRADEYQKEIERSFDLRIDQGFSICGEVVVKVNTPNDPAGSITQFFVIGRQVLRVSGSDKTAVLIRPRQRGDVQSFIENRSTEIERFTELDGPNSNPLSAPAVLVELDGHQDESPVRTFLEELQNRGCPFQILGSYPRAVY